jgi:WD40 repeat protein
MRFQRLISGILIFSLIPLLAVAFPSTSSVNAILLATAPVNDPTELPEITVKNAGSLKQIAVLHTGNKEDSLWQQALEWMPDGNTIAAINDKGIWLFDINDLQSPPKLLAEKNVCCIEFSNNGSLLLSMSDQLANKIWDMKTKQAEALGTKIGPFGEAQFSPNGKYLAS